MKLHLAFLTFAVGLGQSQNAPDSQGSLIVTVRSAVADTLLRRADVTVTSIEDTGQSYPGTTDQSGSVTFQLPPGKYRARAHKEGYISPGESKVIMISKGSDVSETLSLTPKGGITGTVYDDQGDPVPNAQVRVFRSSYHRGRQIVDLVGSSESDLNGAYTLASLEPGPFFVQALPNGRVMADGHVLVPSFYGGSVELAAAARVEVLAGIVVSSIDIRLPSTKGRTVSGRLTLPDGSPVSGARILFGTGSHNSSTIGIGPVTNRDGTFTISGLAPGTYYLAEAISKNGVFTSNAESNVQVDVTKGDVTDVALVPSQEARLTVRMMGKDARSTDVKSVVVSVEGVDSLSASQTTFERDQTGSWGTKSLPSSKYSVAISGVPPGACVGAVKMGSAEISGDINVAGSSLLEITLESDCGEVDGKAAPNARVVLTPVTQRSFDVRTTLAHGNGEWAIMDVLPGEYKAFAFDRIPEEAWFNTEYMRPYDNDATNVKVVKGERSHVEALKILSAR